MPTSIPITVAHGDGTGPEIMAATLNILTETGAALDIEAIDVGEKAYLSGNTTGMAPESWASLRRTKVCRFLSKRTSQAEINALVGRITGLGLPIGMTVSLRSYDGKAGFTPAEGL